MMQLYPAIDLRNGACVRLYQGDFSQETRYGEDPFDVADKFLQQGATWLHIVDLDSAKNPAENQLDLIVRLIRKFNVNIQTGGGIRQSEQIKKLLDTGIQRVVVGSKAVHAPFEVREWLHYFGAERISIAADVQIVNHKAFIAAHGWQALSDKKLNDMIDYYQEMDLKHLLCTDIARDGTLQGPNFELYENLLARYPDLHIQASGGIGSLQDVKTLKTLHLPGAILGKSLYENKFTLAEAFQVCN